MIITPIEFTLHFHNINQFWCVTPKGGQALLESQGCHFIPSFIFLFCLVLLLMLSFPFFCFWLTPTYFPEMSLTFFFENFCYCPCFTFFSSSFSGWEISWSMVLVVVGVQGCHFSVISLISGKSEALFQGNSCLFNEKDMYWCRYLQIACQKDFFIQIAPNWCVG